MQLDVRVPMGLMFVIIGVMLLGYGLVTWSDTALYERSLGYNVNLWWGLFLAAFGGAMLWLARRAARPSAPPHDVPK
jgi:amino acid permease